MTDHVGRLFANLATRVRAVRAVRADGGVRIGGVRIGGVRIGGVRGDRRGGSAHGNRAAPDARVLGSVRWRLALWSGGATLVVLAILGVAIYGAVAGSLASAGRSELEARGDTIARVLTNPRLTFGDRNRLPLGPILGGAGSGTLAYVVTPNDVVYAPAELAADGLPNAAGIDAARAGKTDVRDATVSGVPVRILSEPAARGEGTFVVQIVQDITTDKRTLEALLGVLLVGGLLGVLGAVAVGAVYAQRALVPIRDSLRRQREFAADASHELRTPLTVIRSAVEYIQRHPERHVADVQDALTDVGDEVEHLTALVGDLLLLARTDSGTIDVERMPVDLADVAVEGLSSVSPLAATRGVRLTLDPEAGPVLGDPTRLRQLVTILADNAIAHSPPGGLVNVAVRSSGRTAALVVEDEGPGIRPEDLPRVFDRFWRAPDSPSGGTGLGLAIAAWIVERHGGTIDAANREQGGARFSVRLPLERTAGVSAPAAGDRAEPDAGHVDDASVRQGTADPAEWADGPPAPIEPGPDSAAPNADGPPARSGTIAGKPEGPTA